MCVCWKGCSSGKKEQGKFKCSPPQRYYLTQIPASALNIQLIPSLFLSCWRRYVYWQSWLYYFHSLELQVSSVSRNSQRAFLTLKSSLLFQKAEFLPQRCHCAPFVLRKDVKNLRHKWHMLLAFEKAGIQNGERQKLFSSVCNGSPNSTWSGKSGWAMPPFPRLDLPPFFPAPAWLFSLLPLLPWGTSRVVRGLRGSGTGILQNLLESPGISVPTWGSPRLASPQRLCCCPWEQMPCPSGRGVSSPCTASLPAARFIKYVALRLQISALEPGLCLQLPSGSQWVWDGGSTNPTSGSCCVTATWWCCPTASLQVWWVWFDGCHWALQIPGTVLLSCGSSTPRCATACMVVPSAAGVTPAPCLGATAGGSGDAWV